MKKAELIKLLNELGLKPSRKLGQNFLIDPRALDAIVAAAAPQAGETVLEIGPGAGVLTERLLAAGARVVAVEIDRRLAGFLRQRLAGSPGFQLHLADACRVNYAELGLTDRFACIANLPYAVSTIVLGRLFDLECPPRRICVLLQREMAERLAAAPSTKAYGAISVKAQLLYTVKLVRHFPPAVFYPPPEVQSSVVLLSRFEAESLAAPVWANLQGLLRLGFGQRRKQLAGLWRKAQLPTEPLLARLAALGLPEDVRAEAIAPEQWRTLAETLSASAAVNT